MVLTLKAKEGLERDNPLPGRPVRADRQPGSAPGDGRLRRAVHGRHRLPVPRLVPDGKTVVQLDARSAHIGRRTSVDHALVGDVGDTLRGAAAAARAPGREGGTSTRRDREVRRVARAPAALLPTPVTSDELIGRVRAVFDNPDDRIRPEAVGGGSRPARRPRRGLHHRHRDVDGVGVAVREMTRPAPAARLLQPRLDGQRDAAGPRRAGARPRPPGRSRAAATAV